jgi:DNA (cytosine-5)-methyltransferase 1
MQTEHPRIVNFIDLFAGAGGLAQGFKQASDAQIQYRSVFAVEIEKPFAASYEANFGHSVFARPIEKLRKHHLPPNVQLVIGGPPCQGFSPLGQMSPTDAHQGMNELWRYFFKVVKWTNPLAFVVENVPEFLKSAQFVEVKRTAKRLGYDIAPGVLKAEFFGVSQRRRRGFIVGLKDGIATLPEATHEPGAQHLGKAIYLLRDLPLRYDFSNEAKVDGKYVPHPARELHIGRRPTELSLRRYRLIKPGENRFALQAKAPKLTPQCWINKKTGSSDVMGRLEWDKPALTIRTEFFKPEKGRYLHPEQDRPITHYEAAKIQSFPDDYLFCGSKIEIARQIGNAVPPNLAEAVARHLKPFLLDRLEATVEFTNAAPTGISSALEVMAAMATSNA